MLNLPDAAPDLAEIRLCDQQSPDLSPQLQIPTHQEHVKHNHVLPSPRGLGIRELSLK